MKPEIIESQPALEKRLRDICGAACIAIDTESNSFYAHSERLCLIQISDGENDLVVDSLRITGLTAVKELLENEKIEKVFHAAESDIRLLKRELACEVRNIFDTMTAARFLGMKQCGLSFLLEKYFNVRLNKKFQRADWGKRPLSGEMAEYAAMDAHYLPLLGRILERELAEKGLLREAREEFRRIALAVFAVQKFRENSYLNWAGAKLMNGRSLAVLRELYLAREETAKKLDISPFRIMQEELIIRLALNPRESLRDLRGVKGFSPYIFGRHGEWIRNAMLKGLEAPEVSRSKRPQEKKKQFEFVNRRIEALRQWRKFKAQERGLPSEVILHGKAVSRIAYANPSTLEELKNLLEAGSGKLELYGKEILQALKIPDKSDQKG